MAEMNGKIVEKEFFLAYRKDVPEKEVNDMEDIIRKAINESRKPRCKACVPCPMGIIGCDYDDIPHGHGSAERCPECGILYYRVHPHSKSCSRATPITDEVRHDQDNIWRQFRDEEIEKKFRKKIKNKKDKEE